MADDNNTVSNILLREIIYYLPAKSVIRFKSVSTYWNSIISEPDFIRSYITRNPHPSWFVFERTLNLSSNGRFPIEFIFKRPPNLSTLSIDFHGFDPYPFLGHPVLVASSGELLLVGPKISDMSQWALSGYNFFVINAITKEWVALPKPGFVFDHSNLGLITQIDRNNMVFREFNVVAYLPSITANRAILLCFSSETAKWEMKLTNYMLGDHIWGLSGRGNFEFNGKLIWYDLNVGLIIWDDPFSTEKIVECRLIRLPLQHVRSNEHRKDDERLINNGGGLIHYLRISEDSIVSLWRLHNLEEENWNYLYSWDLSLVYPYFGKVMPVLFHPFKYEVAIFRRGNTLISLELRTAKLKSIATILSHISMHFVPVVLPSWPRFFTPIMHARFLKEHGNQCFGESKYDEAIYFYTRSIEFTENVQVYMLRGKTYNKLHKSHEAKEDFLKAIEIDSYIYQTYRTEEVERLNNQHLSL
ncbi:F-box protein At1g49990-like [Amaranthus tricolor]|uniref:F-box protein At1g49990-like n=1 Tax=Amaranthus tricolor TaxID=29722 RepID=UPI00258D4005|nr:F-box protein At1g49990-like [Amaranthus tricolor]